MITHQDPFSRHITFTDPPRGFICLCYGRNYMSYTTNLVLVYEILFGCHILDPITYNDLSPLLKEIILNVTFHAVYIRILFFYSS